MPDSTEQHDGDDGTIHVDYHHESVTFVHRLVHDQLHRAADDFGWNHDDSALRNFHNDFGCDRADDDRGARDNGYVFLDRAEHIGFRSHATHLVTSGIFKPDDVFQHLD